MDSQSAAPRSGAYSSQLLLPRACGTCARAKTRCEPGDEKSCQRCLRLKRDCGPAHALPRSYPRKRRGTPSSRAQRSQVEKLEEKLDGLASLIYSAQLSNATHEAPAPVQVSTSFASSIRTATSNLRSQESQLESPSEAWPKPIAIDGSSNFLTPTSFASDQQTTPTIQTAPTVMCGPERIIAEKLNFSDEEENILLNRFRNEMAPSLPFLIIPPFINAEELKNDRPFLLKAICAVASLLSNQRLSLGKWLVEQLAERMAVNLDRSLDLLLGALTYAGWSFHNCHNIPQLTLLLSLCQALVFDLGLNKPIPKSTQKTSFEQVLARPVRPGFAFRELPTRAESERTLEERRAFLGVFFMISSASKFFRVNLDPPRITPYLYECIEILDGTQEQPTDIFATSIVRLQIIVERISQCPWNTEGATAENLSFKPPMRLYMKSLQEQLQSFRSTLPAEVGVEDYMLMHYYHAEETLYEIGLSKVPASDDLKSHNFDRMEILYDCLRSTRRFWETFFGIPETKYAYFSTAMWMQISHSFLVLQSLSTFDHPDWPLPSIRQEIDFMEVLEKLINRVNKIEGQLFAKAATKMAIIKSYIEEQMAADAASSRPESLTGQDADFGRTWEPIDFLDEQFFEDIMGMEF